MVTTTSKRNGIHSHSPTNNLHTCTPAHKVELIPNLFEHLMPPTIYQRQNHTKFEMEQSKNPIEVGVLIRERIPRNVPTHTIFRGYITCAADFAHQERQYIALSSRPASFAGDFPQDDETLRSLAKTLSDAMLDFDGAVEAGQKSVTRIYQLSPFEIELKSWQLLFVLRDVQLGQVGLPGWGKLWTGEDFACFMDRYNDTVSKLHVSKSLVSSLFEQDFSTRLALAPASELKKKLANKNNNARRAVELAMVREDKKRKQNNEDTADGTTYGAEASKRLADDSEGTNSRSLQAKRSYPNDYSPIDDQLSSGGHRDKRFRHESSSTASNETQHLTYPGNDDYNAGSSANCERTSNYSFSLQALGTPGLTPSTEVATSTGYTDAFSLPDEQNSGDIAGTASDSILNAFQTDSGFYEVVGQGTQNPSPFDNALDFDADWMNNYWPELNGTMASHIGNVLGTGEAFSIAPEKPYDSSIAIAEPLDIAKNFSLTSEDLDRFFDQGHDFPADAAVPNGSDERTLQSGESYDANLDSSALDEPHHVEGA